MTDEVTPIYEPGSPRGDLVSVAADLLRSPSVQALVQAVALESGNLDSPQISQWIVERWTHGVRPVRAVIERWGLDLVVRAGFRHRGYPTRTPDPGLIDPALLKLVPLAVCRRFNFLVAEVTEDPQSGTKSAVIITADPDSPEIHEEVSHRLVGYEVLWAVATVQSIQAALRALADRAGITEEEMAASRVTQTTSGVEDDDANSPVALYLSALFNDAVALDASDIHFGPGPDGLEIRFRLHGVLVHRANVNGNFGRGLIARLRIICDMKPSSNTKEDGGGSIMVGERRIDLRVSIVPSVWDLPGCTVRLLATRTELMSLHHLYEQSFVRRYLEAVDLPDGFVLVVGKTGDGKPLSIDTLVLMADGSRKRLGAIEVGDQVITGAGRARRVEAVHEQGPLPALRIETVHGREVVSARDHPFLTPSGWVEAQDLSVGMALANLARRETASSEARKDAEFVLAGLMAGDGTCTGYSAFWDHRKQRNQLRCLYASLTADGELAKALFLACDELGFRYRHVAQARDVALYSLSGGIREWLRDVGLASHGSLTKRVPEFVFRGSDQQVALFLSAYLATDGSVGFFQPAKGGGPLLKGLDCFSSNKSLLQDVQHLLLRLGAQSFLLPKRARSGATYTNGEPYTSWRLFIGQDWDACSPLAADVPISGVKGALLMSMARPLTRCAEALLGDEIAYIGPAGTVKCRCLTIADDHTFIAGDLVVHNSTTLAATLSSIATPDRKACSVEDPVENRLPFILQVQVNEKAGLTFDEALRAFLRSDPDIIMVGEIRDRKTAKIATQAAQTGHLVLGTLHIRDASSAPSRLIRDFDIEPVAVADTLTAVLSQRLLRVLCRECRVRITPDADWLLDNMGWPREREWVSAIPRARFYDARPGGCDNCKQTGYLGRKATPELLVVSPRVQEAIVDGKPAYTIREIALEEGMQPMWVTALGVAAQGETTFAEIQRVLRAPPPPTPPSTHRPSSVVPMAHPPSAPEPEASAPAGDAGGADGPDLAEDDLGQEEVG